MTRAPMCTVPVPPGGLSACAACCRRASGELLKFPVKATRAAGVRPPAGALRPRCRGYGRPAKRENRRFASCGNESTCDCRAPGDGDDGVSPHGARQWRAVQRVPRCWPRPWGCVGPASAEAWRPGAGPAHAVLGTAGLKVKRTRTACPRFGRPAWQDQRARGGQCGPATSARGGRKRCS